MVLAQKHTHRAMVQNNEEKENWNHLTSFPISIPLISFSHLSALSRDSSIILRKSGKREQPRHIPEFNETV